MRFLRKLFTDQGYAALLEKFSLDSPEVTCFHREKILRKKFLYKLYCDWYNDILSRIHDVPAGPVLEIGSGGGFIKNIRSDIITSDILPLPHCDKVLSADKIPFESNSLGAILMTDTFHHLPDCEKFLYEAQRTLKKGGKIVMVEPANTVLGRLIYRNFHHEPFNDKTPDWSFPASGPLSSANIALPWIVFCRDASKFRKNYPLFTITGIDFHTPFAYLISGGFPYKSLLPAAGYHIVRAAEFLLSPFSRWLGMFMTVEVLKTG